MRALALAGLNVATIAAIAYAAVANRRVAHLRRREPDSNAIDDPPVVTLHRCLCMARNAIFEENVRAFALKDYPVCTAKAFSGTVGPA